MGAEGSCQLFFTSLVPWKKLVPIPLSNKKKKERKKGSANEKHTRGGGEGIGGGGWQRGGRPWWMTGGRKRDVGLSTSSPCRDLKCLGQELRARASPQHSSQRLWESKTDAKIERKKKTTTKKKHLRASVVQLCQYLYSWWINEPQHTQRDPSSVCDVFMCHIVTEPKIERRRISASDLLLKAGTSLSSVHTGTYKVMQYPSNTSI